MQSARQSEPFTFPRAQVIPGVNRADFLLDGAAMFTYDFGEGATRPCLFPVRGVSGAPLTRMGHPNPVGHEHHRSIWFGHQKVNGINFWEEREGVDVSLRHRRVTLYHDGTDFGGLVAEVDWWANGRAEMRQTLTLVLAPQDQDSYVIDMQSRFEAVGGPVEFGKTNFGFLGVRVAKTISEQFGGGTLRNDRGDEGEPAIFGRTSRWVDYSGPIAPGKVEGICYMDHPSNMHHPTPWHVRRDGWMEAAFNLNQPHGIARDHPLELRYRLLVHREAPTVPALREAWESFAALPRYRARKDPGDGVGRLTRED